MQPATPEAASNEADVPDDGQRVDRQLFAGLAWTAIYRWSAQIISWAGTLYAARILAPSDYGMIAMAMVPIGLVRMVEDFGLDAVLVQDRTLGRSHLAQLAGLALALGGALVAIIVALAVPIEHFYRTPGIAVIVAALSLIVFLEAAQLLPRARLQIEMRFGLLGALMLLQTVVSTVVLVTAATLSFGVWSLVLNTLLATLVVTVVLIALRPYPVSWPRRLGQLSRPLTSGWRLLVSRAGYYVYSSADQAIIGRFLGRDASGIYSFAQTFSTLPIQEITSVVSKVLPGVFSAVQTKPAELRRYFLLLGEATSLVAFPAAAGLAVIADVLVEVALGPKWEGVVLPLRILCLYSIFYAAQMQVSHVLLWTGRFRASMWLTIFAALVLPLVLLVGSRFGLEGIAAGMAAGFFLTSFPGFILAARIIELPMWDYAKALWPAIVGSALMCTGLLWLRGAMPDTLAPVVTLGALVLAGMVIYAAATFMLFRRRILTIVETVRAARR